MLTNINDMLRDAKRERKAVGAFNVYNFDTIRGVAMAAKEAGDAPVIMAFGQKYLTNMSMKEVRSLTDAITGTDPDLPIALHLDHCSDPDLIREAMDAGFTSVMFDGSRLPYEENVRLTKAVCQMAHARGRSVEGELGSLAAGRSSEEGGAEDRERYTDPDQAAEFVKATGVDALAVSIGTVHGMYQGTPNIRIDILKEINEACRIPLVLHGGSGTPEKDLLACIENGIAKINMNTEISQAAVKAIRGVLAESPENDPPHLSSLSLASQEAVRGAAKRYIQLFRGELQ